MTLGQRLAVVAVTLCCAGLLMARSPAPAQAFNPLSTACTVAGWFSGLVGKACSAGNKLLGLGKKVIGGASASSSKLQAAVGLAAIGAWVMGGAKVAMEETAKVLGHTTTPRLTTTWFSSTYWRVAGIAAILTLPFLFAAAVQALTRSDLALLARAAFGYLPLALIAVGIAAPLIMLLLSATDEMCNIVSAAAGNAGPEFLTRAGRGAGFVSILDGSAFLAFLIGLFVALGGVVLWLELLLREAAVYVIVLMLPLAFAALVWPARRIWAIRAVELLVALILSKFAIVAVLTLGGSALGRNGYTGATSMMVGLVLVTLGTLAPWAMLRLIPLAEMASGAVSAVRGDAGRIGSAVAAADSAAHRLTSATSGGSAPPQDGDIEDNSRPARAARAERERLDGLPQRPQPHQPDRTNGHRDEGSGDEDAAVATADTEEQSEAAASTAQPVGPDDIFSAPDYSWPPVRLGIEDGWPPRSPLDHEGSTQASPRTSDRPPSSHDVTTSGGQPEPTPGEASGPGEDHNPLPPEQEPEDGRL
jgi:hypothetical protein